MRSEQSLLRYYPAVRGTVPVMSTHTVPPVVSDPRRIAVVAAVKARHARRRSSSALPLTRRYAVARPLTWR